MEHQKSLKQGGQWYLMTTASVKALSEQLHFAGPTELQQSIFHQVGASAKKVLTLVEADWGVTNGVDQKNKMLFGAHMGLDSPISMLVRGHMKP